MTEAEDKRCRKGLKNVLANAATGLLPNQCQWLWYMYNI